LALLKDKDNREGDQNDTSIWNVWLNVYDGRCGIYGLNLGNITEYIPWASVEIVQCQARSDSAGYVFSPSMSEGVP